MKLEVVILSESGVPIEEGFCCNPNLHNCVDQNPLGDEDVGVVLYELPTHSEVHSNQMFLLHRRPLWNIMLEGVSLRDHEQHNM